MYKILSELPLKDLRQLTKEFNRGSSKNSTKNQLIASLMAPNQTGGSNFSELPAQVILDEFINKLDLNDLSNLIQSDPDLWRIIQNVPMLKSVYDEKMLLERLHRLRAASSFNIYYIEEFKSLERLGLSRRGLRSIPPEIGALQQLQYLELSHNMLTEIPPEIGDLQKLQYLDLSRNMLTKIPPEIGDLPQLQYLNLSRNMLTEIPPEIGDLQKLQELHLYENQLTLIPPEIGNLQALRELWLDLNQLTEIPPEIGNLRALEGFLLESNRLSAIPPEIGNLRSLEGFSLAENQLTDIPSEIGKLRLPSSKTENAGNLRELNLRDNKLSAAVINKIRELLPGTKIWYDK